MHLSLPIHWYRVLSREWRCSWSSADRRAMEYRLFVNIIKCGFNHLHHFSVLLWYNKIRIHLRMRYNGRWIGIALFVFWVMMFCSTGFVQLLQLEIITCAYYNIIHSPVNHPNRLATLRRNTKFLIKPFISDMQYKILPKYRNRTCG